MDGPSFSPADIAAALQRCYGFPPAKALALASAGPGQMRSPWDVPGMDALVERLVAALRRGEALVLFGDFDADGVTGSAILFHTLAAYSDRVQRYNPFYREGYGLHVSQVEAFQRQGVRLIVTVDSGATSYEAVERAHQLGMEVLVTDHHLPRPDRGPAGTLAVDPPDHLLSGAQLAYLTARAVEERMAGRAEPDPWGLALSAVGAQGDWVPVDYPETRAWVALGLAAIRSPHCPPGLRTLQEVLGERYIGSEMRPLWGLLNMGKRSHRVDPNQIVEALLPETPEDRRWEIFRRLVDERMRTYAAAEAFTAQALEGLRRQKDGGSGLFIYQVEVDDDSLAEVEGPLTARIAEMLGRPVLVLRPAGERINFSGRARGDFSFESFLSDPEIYSLTLSVGGHRQAIGGSIRPQERRAFLEAVRRWEARQPPAVATSHPRPPIFLEQLDPPTALLYGRAIGPFGHGLRPPRFRATVVVRGGWAFSQDHLIELDRPLPAGRWEITFRFREDGCDGETVALRVLEAQRRET